MNHSKEASLTFWRGSEVSQDMDYIIELLYLRDPPEGFYTGWVYCTLFIFKEP